ncbi:hypothetical protein HYW53_04050 [Candidatus Giovannonibacteria bacterium]|nr:hypothetical protein [Candidatus Giovannonibacteria bacterium]
MPISNGVKMENDSIKFKNSITKRLQKFYRYLFIIPASFLISINFYLFLPISNVHASTIINRPLYIGLNNGLVGQWSFDDQDMSVSPNNVFALDRSGNSNNGKLKNTATSSVHTQGKIGQALSFDGTDDYVGIADQDSFTFPAGGSGMTVSLWANVRSVANHPSLIDKYQSPFEWTLNMHGTGVVAGLIYDNAGGSYIGRNAPIPSLNTWHHIVMTYDGGTSSSGVKIYVDGIQTDNTNSQGGVFVTMRNTASTVNIGRSNGGGYGYVNGSIDDVRIYNRALSGEEIKRLYKIGATAKINTPIYSNSLQNGLVGSWSFDGKDMSQSPNNVFALDNSGNANNGKLKNMATSSARLAGKIGQALSFDGTDDYVNAGNVSSSVKTVAFWVKAATSTNAGNIMDLNGTANITLSNGTITANNFTDSSTYTKIAGKNTMLYQNQPDTNYAGNIYLLNNGASGYAQRDALYFDISDFTDTSSSISSATLYMRENAPNNVAGYNMTMQIYKLTSDSWGESTATWNNLAGSYVTSNPSGGSYNPLPGVDGTWVGTTITNIVKDAIDNVNRHVNVLVRLSDEVDGSYHQDYFHVRTTSGSEPYVEITYSPSATVYVDGIQNSSINDTNWHLVVVSTDTALNASAVNIGRISSGYFGGSIDDVRIYNRALSGEEIKRLYKIGTTLKVNSPLSTGTLSNGLVGHWTMDGGDISKSPNNYFAMDRSGNGNTGKLKNMATSSAQVIGKLGQALSFDGTDDLVLIGNNSNFALQTYTMSAWVKLNVTNAYQMVVGLQTEGGTADIAGAYLRFDNTGHLTHFVARDPNLWAGGEVDTTTTYSADTWYHVAATKIGATLKIFVNGTEAASGTITTETIDYSSASTPKTTIGAFWDGQSSSFGSIMNGSIDDVRIYNRALLADEIKRLYQMGK